MMKKILLCVSLIFVVMVMLLILIYYQFIFKFPDLPSDVSYIGMDRNGVFERVCEYESENLPADEGIIIRAR